MVNSFEQYKVQQIIGQSAIDIDYVERELFIKLPKHVDDYLPVEQDSIFRFLTNHYPGFAIYFVNDVDPVDPLDAA